MGTMRLLVLAADSQRGGLARSCAAVTQYLLRRGHDCRVLSLNPPPDGANPFGFLNGDYDHVCYRGPWGIRSLASLLNRIRQYDFDVLWVCHPTFAGCLAAKMANCRARILSLHWPHFPYGLEWRAKLKWSVFYRLFGHDYCRILCDTEFQRDELLAVAPDMAHKVVVAGLPIAGTRGGMADVERNGGHAPDNGRMVVGSAGWLRPGKRFDIVLMVARAVLSHNLNVEFRIAGDGPMKAQLTSQARELGISSRVRFLGWVDSMAGFYKSLDALIFCSDFETAGRVVGEAMWHRLPVVCSVERGGTGELIQHFKTGFFFGSHDVLALSAALLLLLRDPGLRRQIGEAARDYVAEQHSVETVGAHYERLLQSAAARQSHHRATWHSD